MRVWGVLPFLSNNHCVLVLLGIPWHAIRLLFATVSLFHAVNTIPLIIKALPLQRCDQLQATPLRSFP